MMREHNEQEVLTVREQSTLGIIFHRETALHAFNEGTRLGHCIKIHKRLFGVDANAVHLAERLAELKETKTA